MPLHCLFRKVFALSLDSPNALKEGKIVGLAAKSLFPANEESSALPCADLLQSPNGGILP
jgi:hypothetical protein